MNPETQKILNNNRVDKVAFYVAGSAIANNVFTACVFINSKLKRIESRGVAICSLRDTFSKVKGKNIAFGRAMKALIRKENKMKINGSSRDDKVINRSFKVKDAKGDLHFRSEIAGELSRIDPTLPVNILKSGKIKKYSYNIPLSYPIKLANNFFKYKSHYRPVPVGTEEQQMLKELDIFTEPMEEAQL